MSALELTLWIVFCASACLCGWVYLGYPALMVLLARVRPREVQKNREFAPSVTVIIPVFNEEALVERKLRNTLATDYPGRALEVLVVSDGSTDATSQIVRRFEGEQADGMRVRLLELPRKGKVHALNVGAEEATGEILVMTDGNAWWSESTLRELVASFADPSVGGVCGNKFYSEGYGSDATIRGESLYWRFDKWLKMLESRVGSIFAADGTLYAIRKTLYLPISDPAQADDIAISARVVLQGYRLVFEPEARVFEEPPVRGASEFGRKVRVTNHSVRALWNLGASLWSSGFYSLELVSHKFLRHLLAFPIGLLLVSQASLIVLHVPGQRFLVGLAIAELACCVLAVLGWALRGHPLGHRRLLSVPYYFGYVNLAAMVGVLSILMRRRYRIWTPRGGAPSDGGLP